MGLGYLRGNPPGPPGPGGMPKGGIIPPSCRIWGLVAEWEIRRAEEENLCTRKPEWWRRKRLPYAGLLAEHGVCACLAFGGVGGGDGVDDGLGFFVADFCCVPGLSAHVPASWLLASKMGMGGYGDQR